MLARSFLVFAAVFGAGVLAESFLALSYFFGLVFILMGAIFFIFGRRFFTGALVLLALGSGVFWYDFQDTLPADFSLLEKQIGQRVVLRGFISDEPDERENYTRLILGTEEGTKVLLTVRRYPLFQYGDEVEVTGNLGRPENFSDFDWKNYLAKDDIYFEMFYPGVKLISSGGESVVKRSLFALKEKFLVSVGRVLPEPSAALLGGLVVGAKRSLPPELLEDFRETGIIHIVVLSGYNITIVADAIVRFFSFLPYFFGLAFGALGIVGFAVMTGASATVVRASIMALLVLLGRATGRVYEITVALFVAGFLMVLNNPKILRFDSSFQLSFLATMALIYLAPAAEPYLKFLPKKFKIREVVAATVSTQIFVLPLLLYKTGLFSVVSLPVNLLVLSAVPATMFFGFLTGVAGFISYFLSLPFGWLTYGLLAYQIKIVEFFSALSFSSFTVSNFPLWLMSVIYIIYAILIFKFTRKRKCSIL